MSVTEFVQAVRTGLGGFPKWYAEEFEGPAEQDIDEWFSALSEFFESQSDGVEPSSSLEDSDEEEAPAELDFAV